MKIISVLFVCITFSFVTCEICEDPSAKMNRSASSMFQEADNELNDIYQQILQQHSEDDIFIEALKTTQRNWIIFRDSELKMKFPDRQLGWYGSVYPMCISHYLTQLTYDRIKTLKQWIDGVEEVYVCSGTIPMKKSNDPEH